MMDGWEASRPTSSTTKIRRAWQQDEQREGESSGDSISVLIVIHGEKTFFYCNICFERLPGFNMNETEVKESISVSLWYKYYVYCQIVWTLTSITSLIIQIFSLPLFCHRPVFDKDLQIGRNITQVYFKRKENYQHSLFRNQGQFSHYKLYTLTNND